MRRVAWCCAVVALGAWPGLVGCAAGAQVPGPAQPPLEGATIVNPAIDMDGFLRVSARRRATAPRIAFQRTSSSA